MLSLKSRISEICKTSAGGTPLKSKREFYDDGDIPWLLSGEVANKNITATRKFITQAGLDGSSAKVFPANTVVIAMYGATAGEVGILRCEAATNQAVCGIFPDERVIPEFLYYFFLNHKQDLIAQAVGNAQPNISQQKIKNTSLNLPPINEQKRIVAILELVFAEIERARANAQQNLNNARELFESYLQQVFSQRGDGWVDISLGNMMNFKHGFAFKSEFFVDKSKHVLLTPGNFYEEGGYRDRGEKQKYYKGEIPNDYILSKGSLLVAMTEQAKGLLGSPALIPEDNQFLHNQRLGLVQLEEEYTRSVSLEFLYYLFNTKIFRSKVQETATGLKVRHTSPKKLMAIVVSIPVDIKVQKAIVFKLDKIKKNSIELEYIYREKIIDLDELKKSILQKAFSGELSKAVAA